MAYSQSSTIHLGATISDLILNAAYRGVYGTPPTTVYAAFAEGVPATGTTEITMTRFAIPCNAANISTANGYQGMLMQPLFAYIGGAVTDKTASSLMVFDAASGGNLLFEYPLRSGNTGVVTGDNIMAVGDPKAAVGTPSLIVATQQVIFTNAMLGWLFSGQPPPYPLGTYPNIYLKCGMVGFDNALSIPRVVGSWSAPANVDIATTRARKVANTAPLQFGPSTAAGANQQMSIVAYLDAALTIPCAQISKYKDSGQYSWQVGDYLSLNAGELEIVSG